MDYKTAPLEHVKSELFERWVFLHLIAALIPNLSSRVYTASFHKETGDWIAKAPEEEIRGKAQELVSKLDELIRLANSRLLPKIDWREIAADHLERCKTGDFSFSHGVPHGWLLERFDCSPLSSFEDLPYHARIGVGPHAGHASIEEDFLLRDAFYMLALCTKASGALEVIRTTQKGKQFSSQEEYEKLSILNQNVATYARNTVFSFYSFVECFINSIGEDFILRNQTKLTTEQCEILRGIKKGNHLSTERKIETFPSIIRADGKRPIVMSDRNQIDEPFKSFVSEVKDVRDSMVHFAQRKAAIVIRPQDWEQRAINSAKICMAVAREFWIACYPGRQLPLYLGQLDETRHKEIAQKRLTSLQM